MNNEQQQQERSKKMEKSLIKFREFKNKKKNFNQNLAQRNVNVQRMLLNDLLLSKPDLTILTIDRKYKFVSIAPNIKQLIKEQMMMAPDCLFGWLRPIQTIAKKMNQINQIQPANA